MRERTKAWLVVAIIAATLGVLSLLSNITTPAQLSGEAATVFAVRRTLSLIINAGTVWGGLGVLAGWLVARLGRSPVGRAALGALAGVAAGLLALGVHYGLGVTTGLMGDSSFSDNRFWFVAALVLGVPLGLIGVVARREDTLGLLARLVVPAGALVEPFLTGWLFAHPSAGWPVVVSGRVAGAVLVVVGLAFAWEAIRRHRVRAR